jgi:hypothetical protein
MAYQQIKVAFHCCFGGQWIEWVLTYISIEQVQFQCMKNDGYGYFGML